MNNSKLPKERKERYEGQFEKVTVPIKGPGLKHFQDWYKLVLEGAFRSGITTGW